MVKQYRVKGSGETFLEVQGETKDGFKVVITDTRHGWTEQKQEVMSRALFESCLRTDYLKPIRA